MVHLELVSKMPLSPTSMYCPMISGPYPAEPVDLGQVHRSGSISLDRFVQMLSPGLLDRPPWQDALGCLVAYLQYRPSAENVDRFASIIFGALRFDRLTKLIVPKIELLT